MKAITPIIFAILLTYVKLEEIGEKCRGSYFTGTCLKLQDCHEAIDMLKTSQDKPVGCGFEKNEPLVCCRFPQRRFKKYRRYCVADFLLGKLPDGSFVGAGIGGFDSLAKEFPHMSALGYGDKSDITWGCGGTLISPNFVLTAAHCLINKNLGRVKFVRLGDLNLRRTDDKAKPQDFTVKQTFKHPGYRPPSQYNDIGLIQLNRDAEFNEYVRPACLNGNPQANHTLLIATGWGQLGYGEKLADHLQKMYINLIPPSECQRSYAKHKGGKRLANGIIDTQMCAGAPKIDTCPGDSGGPLQAFKLEGYLVYGVTSFGIACGISSAPGVYTRVSSYIGWIDSIVWPNGDNFFDGLSFNP